MCIRDSLGTLSPVLIRYPYHRDFRHGRVLVDSFFHSAGVHVVAARQDEVLYPVHYERVPFLVHVAHVSRAQELAGEHLIRIFRTVPVANHHLRTGDAYLSPLALRCLLYTSDAADEE